MRTKKKLFAAALAVCLVSILSFSTLAWFNASESVTNKFMVASTGTGDPNQSEPDKIFSLDLWEVVDDQGNKVSYRTDGLTGQDYKDILPGVPYIKAPTVENTGSYDQYIRVVVTVSKAAEWTTLLANYGINDMGTIFLGHDETAWTRSDAPSYNATENTVSYVYYLNSKLAPLATATLFEKVQLPGVLTQKDMADMGGEFEIKVRADAIQTEGLGDGIDTAQKAFNAIGWTADVTYDQAMNP